MRGAGTLHYSLGGALLVELALLGSVEADATSGGPFNGPIVDPISRDSLTDPLLRQAYDTVAAKPTRVQPLILALGANLYGTLLERLEERGLIRRESRRVLGVFRTTRWPAADAVHEAELRARVEATLVDGADPDPRTAAVIALVFASGTMPALSPPLPWNSTTIARAQKLKEGDWGAAAVNAAVERTAAAIMASTAVAIATSTASR